MAAEKKENKGEKPEGGSLSEMEKAILDFLQGDTPVRMGELVEKLASRHPMELIHPALLQMEMKQMIIQLPGGYYMRR